MWLSRTIRLQHWISRNSLIQHYICNFMRPHVPKYQRLAGFSRPNVQFRFPQVSRKSCQHRSNMAPKWSQDDQQIDPKTSKFKPKCRRRARKWSPNGVKKGSTKRKNQRKTPTRQKTGLDLTASPLLSRKSGQHGPNLGVKMEPG